MHRDEIITAIRDMCANYNGFREMRIRAAGTQMRLSLQDVVALVPELAGLGGNDTFAGRTEMPAQRKAPAPAPSPEPVAEEDVSADSA